MCSQFAVLFHMFLMLFYLGKDIIFFVHISRCAGGTCQVRNFIFFVRKLCVQVGNGAQVKIPRQCDLSGRDCNPDNSIREGGNWGGVALSSF